jgi:hypothetical protein
MLIFINLSMSYGLFLIIFVINYDFIRFILISFLFLIVIIRVCSKLHHSLILIFIFFILRTNYVIFHLLIFIGFRNV